MRARGVGARRLREGIAREDPLPWDLLFALAVLDGLAGAWPLGSGEHALFGPDDASAAPRQHPATLHDDASGLPSLRCPWRRATCCRRRRAVLAGVVPGGAAAPRGTAPAYVLDARAAGRAAAPSHPASSRGAAGARSCDTLRAGPRVAQGRASAGGQPACPFPIAPPRAARGIAHGAGHHLRQAARITCPG